MIADLVARTVLANLEATYFAVGLQGEGAWRDEWDGGCACLSRLEHPVSNFAIAHRVDLASAQRLVRFASERTAFNVYVLPGGDQEAGTSNLARSGFRRVAKLNVMLGSAAGTSSGAPLERADGFEQRLFIARFMARQFFYRQTSALREAIALTTARSSIELYADSLKTITGSAMLSRSPGAIGIYNLCVDQNLRDRGVGSSILSALTRLGSSPEDLITLQCEPGLEPWYSNRGFETIGAISVMALERKASPAIM